MSTEVLIEATGLRKYYASRVALDDVSLTVHAGEIVGLLGPNGAGKTTTLAILAMLLEPEAGEVRVRGVDARGNRASLARMLGYVPQSLALYPSLSALENVRLFSRISGLSTQMARVRAVEVLDIVGLGDRGGDLVWTLSGGMKRRLNLACALAHRPRVLLLDEPTVGVDPQSREAIFATIREAASDGAGILYSTHYMEEVERLCDRALLIDRGGVVASGTVSDIIALGGRQPRMRVTFEALPPLGWCEIVAGAREVERSSEDSAITLELAGLAQAAELLDRARGIGSRVLEFTVHNPNLSDAFIALTGRALRDDRPEA